MSVLRTTPILESGDNLARARFHRRSCARPDIKLAELVEGVVYVASPLRQGGVAARIISCRCGLVYRQPGTPT
jgi:hypothetical protein